ncbi:MAG: cobalamin-dependent protein [Deltaproteobacteria bacterium]|nr:cobalamin-dependent protein [Deltaproteobacteria bacterium]
MIEACIANISKLKAVPPQSADKYATSLERMIDHVNRQLGGRPDVMELIGHNPLQMMVMNHQHHAQFMLTVFRLNAFDLLVRTIPWVYRAYHSRGFSYDYFPIELLSWKQALLDNSSGADIQHIIAVYDWMISNHETMIKLSVSCDTLGFSLPDETNEMQQIFTALLLHGDHKGCLKLVELSVTTPEELRHFYEHVVKYALYTVGTLWERNEISVADEHLATAIVGRVTSFLYGRFVGQPQTKGMAVVSAGPNEFHEVGARMVADMLELDGWDVTYLGANTPLEELIKLLVQKKPFLLALSVATAFNLENAQQLITSVRGVPEISRIRILAGGLAFNCIPRLWHDFGADGFAANLADAVALCDSWWQEGVVQ